MDIVEACTVLYTSTMNILHIDSCALGDHSASRMATAAALAALTEANQQATVLYRDLAATPLSHASGPLLQVINQRWNSSIPMNAELSAEALQSASLQQEFQDADVVVIGAPMHNFSMPSPLKAWMDRLIGMRPTDRRVLLITSGCLEKDAPQYQFIDHHETLLKAAFQFMGVSQLSVMRDPAALRAAL